MLVAALKRLPPSGEGGAFAADIARQLNADASAVARMLDDAAVQFGVVQKDESGKFRLAFPMEWLTAEAILRRLESPKQLHIALEVDSTNLEIRRREIDLVAAEHQHSGRGRQGRQWLAMPGGSLLFSARFFLHRPIAECGGFALACGVAAAKALEKITSQAKIKWPNDIVADGGKKLGGILIEMIPQSKGVAAVVGVGLNLMMSDSLLRIIGQPSAGLNSIARESFSRAALLADVYSAINDAAIVFGESGFDSFRAESIRRHAIAIGDEIAFHHSSGEKSRATFCGIGKGGELLLESPSGVVKITSGEINAAGD